MLTEGMLQPQVLFSKDLLSKLLCLHHDITWTCKVPGTQTHSINLHYKGNWEKGPSVVQRIFEKVPPFLHFCATGNRNYLTSYSLLPGTFVFVTYVYITELCWWCKQNKVSEHYGCNNIKIWEYDNHLGFVFGVFSPKKTWAISAIY